jgi:hypothetical protein
VSRFVSPGRTEKDLESKESQRAIGKRYARRLGGSGGRSVVRVAVQQGVAGQKRSARARQARAEQGKTQTDSRSPS